MRVSDRYSHIQIALHWAIAGLIVVNFIAGDAMEDAVRSVTEGNAAGFVASVHVYTGLAVLALVAVRLAFRLLRPVAMVHTGKPLLDRVAEWGHIALYALMVAVPVLGAMTWYGGIEIAGPMHTISTKALMVLAAGHSVAALFHHFVLRDGLLRRMSLRG